MAIARKAGTPPTPELREVPHHEMLRWQWHSSIPWIDERYGRTSYIAGFATRKSAIDYGIMCGWV